MDAKEKKKAFERAFRRHKSVGAKGKWWEGI